METEFLDWHTARDNIGEPWQRLVVAGRHNVSLDPRWLQTVLESQAFAGNVRVAALFDGGRLRAVLPYMESIERWLGLPIKVVSPCANVIAYHAEVVGEAEDVRRLLQDVMENAFSGSWDVIRLVAIVDDSSTARILPAIAESAGCRLMRSDGERSPYIKIDGEWEGFLKSRDKKFRANYSRAIRRMEAAGETAMIWFEGSCDTDRLLDLILEIEGKSWKFDAGTAISSRQHERDYYAKLLPTLAGMDALMANVLFVGGRPVAYTLCCRYHGWVGQMKTSFDASLADAGARVIDASVKKAFEERAAIYDFLGDAAPHKLKWTSFTRSHSSWSVFSPRIRGRMLGLGKAALAGVRRNLPAGFLGAK